jgi:hypothetical protein
MMAGCSSDNSDEPDIPDASGNGRTQVNIVSRAETDDATDLQAGLFMVNYRDGQPDELLPTDNYVNNQLLTWKNNAWSTSTPIYWNDMDTRADFYAYAPYIETLADARQMAFTVAADQRTNDAFMNSDFLWGTVKGQLPTSDGFNLTLSHQLSQLTVNIVADAGFAEGDLKDEDVSVAIGGTRTHALIDLQTGTVSVLGDSPAENVLCHSNGNLSYTAILLPQQVPFSNLIQVDWLGNKYTLQNSFLIEAKRQYTLTVKLKKTKSGFDIGIEGWDILPEDFGGTVGGN